MKKAILISFFGIVAVLLVAVYAHAATTVGTNITTTGTITAASTTIDVNGSEALLVRKDSDAGDVFIVDTTNLLTTASGTLKVVNHTTSDLLQVFDSSTEVFTILDGGKVGIGSSTPQTLLAIQGTTEQLRLGYNATNYVQFTVSSGGDLTIAPSGEDTNITGDLLVDTTTLYVDSTNDLVGIGSTTPKSLLSVSSPSQQVGTTKLLTVASTTGSILLDVLANGNLAVDTNTLYVDALNSRVGIGTTSPEVLTHVEDPTENATTTLQFGRNNATAGACINMFSPNGTAYRVYITNAGALTAVAGKCGTE